MESPLLEQGVTLMLVGMGTVFVFLTLLVMSMTLMATIVRRFAAPPAETGVSDEEVAIITAAITQHRASRS